jgi:hypothetical protein
MPQEITIKIINHTCDRANYLSCVGKTYKLFKNEDGFATVFVKNAGFRIKTNDIEIIDVRELIANESDVIRIIGFGTFDNEALKKEGYELKLGATYRLSQPLYKYYYPNEYIKYKEYFEAHETNNNEFLFFPAKLLKGVKLIIVDFDEENNMSVTL